MSLSAPWKSCHTLSPAGSVLVRSYSLCSSARQSPVLAYDLIPRPASSVWVLDFVSEIFHNTSSGNFESIIKAGTSKQEGPRVEEATRVEPRRGFVGSLEAL